MDGLIILDSLFKKMKYWKKIVDLEKLHPKDLQQPGYSKVRDIFTKGAITVIYVIGDRVVGECNATPISTLDNEYLKDIYDVEKYLKAKTIQINSIGVREESYSKEELSKFQGKSIAMQMNQLVGELAKAQGYDYIIGHAREGMSLNVAIKLGAKITHEHPDWDGNGTTYFQIEVDLKKINDLSSYR